VPIVGRRPTGDPPNGVSAKAVCQRTDPRSGPFPIRRNPSLVPPYAGCSPARHPVRIDADPPLCNDREQAQVDTALLEQAIQKAIVLGDTVLRELMRPQEAAPAEWDYLRGFRTRDAHSRRRPTRPSTRPCAGACWWSRSTASGGCACR